MKDKVLPAFATAFLCGVAIATTVFAIRDVGGLYVLAAGVVALACILLDHEGPGRTLRETVIDGLVVSVGTITGVRAFGHAYALGESAENSDVTMHVFVAIVALIIVSRLVQKRLKEMGWVR